MFTFASNRYVRREQFTSIMFNRMIAINAFKSKLQGQTIDDIPSAIIEDAAQLVKANSIAGNKMNNIDVVYTMWDNLKKTASMDVGQVSFHRDKGKFRACYVVVNLRLWAQ